MRIWTASWFTRLPPEIQRIGISRGVPRFQKADTYRRLTELNPGPWFNTASTEEYCRLYAEILGALDPKAIVDKIAIMTGGRDAALLCYEKAPLPPVGVHGWCHRTLVANFLQDQLGIEVTEWDFTSKPAAPDHVVPDGRPVPFDVVPEDWLRGRKK